MTTIIGTGEVGALHSREELEEMQRLPLQRKIQITTARIIEWYQHYDGKVYVAFSGGKDSTVLLDIVRRIYPDVPAVFSDTGLEFPEVREFVKSCENVTIVRPEMNFRKVIEVYGYPVISKRVADTVEYAIADWGVAQVARKLGKVDDYEYFSKRALAYQKYWDKDTRFFRGKNQDGSWLTPFNPVHSTHRNDAYCEGNGWQYTWLVPHDVEGLISLLGGDDAFVSKLSRLKMRMHSQQVRHFLSRRVYL